MSRNTHHRERDHFGFQPAQWTTISGGVATYSNYTSLQDLLEDFIPQLPQQLLTTRGDLLVFDGSQLIRFPRGTSGQFLMTDSNGDLVWTTIS